MAHYTKEIQKTIQSKKHPKDLFNLPSLENDAVFVKAAKSNINEWTAKDVSNFLAELGFEKEALLFKKHCINGSALLVMDKDILLDKFQIPLGRALKLYRRINTLQTIASKNNSQ
ncbi:Sterile alpha motif domain-containing protein 13 [Trichinella pseudospiralis]|uniref:Sterile alpha motif domain-containing protein 13 n=1 Tax=Trichinella pseudospiralis TaxID=6337 RepID=A0A0V0YLL8_TRIPS|nr:Sterile alpha motif domain-containing protein 13 [Trichinella pseudospiralis]